MKRISRRRKVEDPGHKAPRTSGGPAYRVLLSHDEEGWSARVEGLAGCRARATTIPRVCAHLRSALPRYAVPRTASLNVVLEHSLGARVRSLRVLRERTERAARAMHDETRDLAITLFAEGLTIRDIGELLGISYQRVQQIIKGD